MTGRLLSPRAASRRTGIPWRDLRPEIEAAGFRIVKLAGRERVAEGDLDAVIEKSRQPTAEEAAARVDLAIDQVAAEMGVARRPRRNRRAS